MHVGLSFHTDLNAATNTCGTQGMLDYTHWIQV